MKRILTAAASVLLLVSCMGGGAKAPSYNAEWLEGIGTLSLGLTTSEVEAALQENARQYGQKYGTEARGLAHYLPLFVYKDEYERGKYEERDAKYYLSKEEALDVLLSLYRDTLVVMRVEGRWHSEGAGYVRDAFREKYGAGIVNGSSSSGRREVWRSEKAEALYYIKDDENPDYRQRKVLEYVELVPTGRDIKKELTAYGDSLLNKQKEVEAQKRATILNGI